MQGGATIRCCSSSRPRCRASRTTSSSATISRRPTSSATTSWPCSSRRSSCSSRRPKTAARSRCQGLVRMAMGEADEATKMLQRATKSDPKNLDSWVALAWVYAQSNQMQDAERDDRRGRRSSRRNDKARLEQVFAPDEGAGRADRAAQPRRAAGFPKDIRRSTALPPQPRQPHHRVPASASPSISTPPPSSAAASSSSSPATPPAARPSPSNASWPASFPINVELTSADSMMGQPLPGELPPRSPPRHRRRPAHQTAHRPQRHAGRRGPGQRDAGVEVTCSQRRLFAPPTFPNGWIRQQLTHLRATLRQPRGGHHGLRSHPRNLIRFAPA